MSYLSIRQAAADIRSGLITPGELLAETLERIDLLDSDIHAFVTAMRDQAFEEAERLEREMRTGLYRSQLHGIPIGVKDIIAFKGIRMTAGSKERYRCKTAHRRRKSKDTGRDFEMMSTRSIS